MNIEKRKTCYNCKNYDSENDWCKKHHGECEAWRHIGQEYTCCEPFDTLYEEPEEVTEE